MAPCAPHIPFPCIRIFPALLPHIPPLSAALHLLPSSVLLWHLCPADAATLPSRLLAWGTPLPPRKTLAAFSKCLQNSLCPSPTSLRASSQTVQLRFGIALCHEWQNLLVTVLRFQEVKKSVSRETGFLLDCFIGENYRERRSKAGACTGKFDHLLGIAL